MVKRPEHADFVHMSRKNARLLEDADAHRPPTPDPFWEDPKLVGRVELVTLGGRRFDLTTVRMSEDSALGSLVAIGQRHAEEGKDYNYLLSLGETAVDCRENDITR